MTSVIKTDYFSNLRCKDKQERGQKVLRKENNIQIKWKLKYSYEISVQ